jgi:hypothetical protein
MLFPEPYAVPDTTLVLRHRSPSAFSPLQTSQVICGFQKLILMGWYTYRVNLPCFLQSLLLLYRAFVGLEVS